jgi:hypothetical protein
MLSWLALSWITACSNPCVDYCKRMEAWLDECSTTWEAEFPDEGWTSVDDCYDHYWDAGSQDQGTCSKAAKHLRNEECY